MTGLDELLQQLFPKQQPTFRPTAIEGLLKPQQAEVKPYSPETFTGLLNEQPSVMRQAGLIGASFAPGAGFSDLAGTYPSAQGGTEPSAAQNLQQGNYITSALQTLGAFGDAATATGAALGPLGLAAGMGVGSVAKVPRAVQKGVQGLIDSAKPKLDKLGFFSQVEKSVMDLGQNKGTGQQFLAQLQNTPGVKPEELQYTGLDTFLANKPMVTKGEIQDYLDTNKVQVQEVTLGSPQALEARDSQIAQRYGYQAELYDGQMSFYDTNLDDYVEFRDLPAAMRTELSNPQTEFGGATKFSQYALPGGTNYREVLLTLPIKTNAAKITSTGVNPNSGKSFVAFELDEGRYVVEKNSNETNQDAINRRINEMPERGKIKGINHYYSSHFYQPNILAHMRINDRTIDGKPTMFVEEIQSDWHQAGRKQGYGTTYYQPDEITPVPLDRARAEYGVDNADLFWHFDVPGNVLQIPKSRFGTQDEAFDYVRTKIKSEGVPDAPFKTSWDELSLKRAIKMASDGGYEQIAFTTGKTQADRYALSRSVDSIDVRGFGDNRRIVQINGKEGRPFQLQVNNDGIVETSMYAKQFEGKALNEIVGKDIAKQLMDATDNKSFSGLDLDVGGEGMKGFYDKMLPKKLEKLGKKYGSKPTKTTMQTPDGEVEVWTFNLPKEMRDTVKEQGQPLFQIGAGAAGLGTAGLLATEEEQF